MAIIDYIFGDYAKYLELIAYFGWPASIIVLIVAYVCVRDWHYKRKF